MGGHLLDKELTKYATGIYKNFIETGTYKGETSRLAASCFETVYTIEIVPELYEYSLKKAVDENFSNIQSYLGDSLVCLPRICKQLKDPSIFFLDAHQSGPDTSNNGKWVPLMEEIDIILSNVDENTPHLFIIDDVRLFSKHWDWENISENTIYERFSSHNKNVNTFYVENDRLYVGVGHQVCTK
jgi:hypothetical protein